VTNPDQGSRPLTAQWAQPSKLAHQVTIVSEPSAEVAMSTLLLLHRFPGGRLSSVDLPRHPRVVTGGGRCGQDAAGVDFFVSHAGRDQAWAEWVAWHLAEAGYTVELDCWDWAAGENFITKMHRAVDAAARVMALFSPAYFDEMRYTSQEWTSALVTNDEGGHRLVPVLASIIHGGGRFPSGVCLGDLHLLF
jgi:TIR domain